jgi:carbon-monoxide dehydrogenase large subunit
MDETAHLRPKIIGARIRRTEDPRLLTGHGNFVDDRQVPNALHVAFRRSDHAHASIVAIDATKAKAAPGVVAVFTALDLDGLFEPLKATSRMAGYFATPLLPLARGKVRYVGEPVVAVVAESRYLAEDAVELIEIDFAPLPAAVDPEAAIGANAPLLHDEAGTNVILSREFKRGDVAAAIAAATFKVRGRFRMRRKTPVAIEARACLAEYDTGRDALTVYSTTQVPGIVRDALSQALDLPGHRLRVIAPDVGGGFGAKGSLYPEELLVSIAARQLERTIKWTSDRMEDLASTSQAFDEIVDAELAFDRDGTALGLAADVIGDVGAYSIYPWTAALEPVQVVSFLPGPYRILHYRGRVRGVATPKAPTGPYRGVGRPISTFVMERLMDMAARKLGLDPKAMRERNLVAASEFPYKVASGIVWDQSGFREGLDAACRAIGYDALRAQQAQARAAGRWYGIGIASYAELTGIGSRISVAPGMPINTGTETADIRIDSTGAVTAAFGIAAHGQGLETTLAQVVAEHLGARFADIRIVQGDSAAVMGGTGTYASRSTVLAGGAATLAAEAVREKVLNAASHLLEAAPADLVAANGTITVVGTDRSLTFRALARAVYSEMGRRPPEARGGGARRARRLPDLRPRVRHHDFRNPHRRGRDRSADLRGPHRPLRRRRRLRPHHQSTDRGRPGPRRRRAGHRRGALRGSGPRRARPAPDRLAGRLRGAGGQRDPAGRSRASRNRIADHARRISRHGRRRHHWFTRSHRQRGRRRARPARHRDRRASNDAGAALPPD